MYYCLIDRYELLNYLPKGGVVAEVGVYRGNFSAHVLDRVCPERYYLIDTWLLNQDSAYADQLRFLPEHDGEIVHAEVQSRFSREIASGQVSMVRRSSLDAASSFVRKTFDWVYIDADHRRGAVLADLQAYGPLVKDDGLLLGHDYVERSFPQAEQMDCGVTDAVRSFLHNSGFQMFLLTGDLWATYCLSRDPDGQATQMLLKRLIQGGVDVTHLNDVQRVRIFWEIVGEVNGAQRFLRKLALD